MLKMEQIFASGHIIKQCDASTGHAVRNVAFCEDNVMASVIVAFVNAVPRLAANKDLVRESLIRLMEHCVYDEEGDLSREEWDSLWSDCRKAIAHTGAS